jgi:hypothetical protein
MEFLRGTTGFLGPEQVAAHRRSILLLFLLALADDGDLLLLTL